MNQRVALTRSIAIFGALFILLTGFVAGTRSEQLYAFVAPLFGIKVETGQLDDSELQSAYQALKASYNGRLDENKLIEGAKDGMVAATGDPYTIYMDAGEAKEFNKELSGDIGGGIGAEVGVRNGQPTFVRTLPDNPAEKAGLHAGDIILGVNDESADGWDAERTVRAIRGQPDTSVKLTVRRGNESKEFSITRAVINNPSVSSKLEGGTGIVTLNRFDENTVSLMRRTVTGLKDRGMKRIVLDMRGNGGGYLESAPGVAGLWLESDKVVVTVRSNTGPTDTLKAEGEPILKGMKTAVLVNGSTASAAEIVAAALKQYGAATIVGEQTFGKGTVQEIIPLDDGGQLKVTIKRWYTPNGVNVTDKKGIRPMVKVGLEQKDLDKGKDPQLDAGIKAVQR